MKTCFFENDPLCIFLEQSLCGFVKPTGFPEMKKTAPFAASQPRYYQGYRGNDVARSWT
jgi:hypothetical protein